jgi:O-antigen/teichoic acid export membrane protein
MSELVVRYGGEYLEKKEHDKAAALMKSAMLGEGTVSLLAFIFVVLTAGLASRYISKTPDTAWMFVVYSIGLLANFNTETSTGILQVTDKIKLQGTINLVQSIVTALIIAAAFFWNGSLVMVLGAYLLGKAILGLGLFTGAQIQLRRVFGHGWSKEPISSLPSFREPFKFAFSSNLSATLILIFRESEILWVGYFLTNEAAGYYKAAYSIVLLLALPIQPLVLTVYPELNRFVVQKAWPRLRDFLRKVTLISFSYNIALGFGLVLFGRWLLWIYGKEYVSAYSALMALLIGMVFNFTLFWNRPILLSLNLPAFPLVSTLVAGLVKAGLAFPLVPRYGYLMEAFLLSFYYVASVGLNVWRSMREIGIREKENQ